MFNKFILLSLLFGFNSYCFQNKTSGNNILFKNALDTNPVSVIMVKDSLIHNKSEVLNFELPYFKISNNYSVNKKLLKQYGFFSLETVKDSLKLEKKTAIKDSSYSDCSYQGYYNKNNLLSFSLTRRFIVLKYELYNEYYNLNLKEGNDIKLNMIFDNIDSILPIINSKIEEYKKYALKDDDFDELEKNNIKTNSFTLDKVPDNFILKEVEGNLSIQFFTSQYKYSSTDFNPYDDLFFTFQELKPYLTDDFKKQIGL
ncbi:hypothetical protein [Aquimarina algiphila]|uniref:hypothetical protein n=1 Tax=Aquimarina algiphila TaxID=2047982 RepID=UPI00232C38DA|nr:hypothetical protein [Aquimarina algiphila]